jgi:hypothetical protein
LAAMPQVKPLHRSNVAIIGKAPSSRHLAPFDDNSWEIWTLSDLVPRKEVPRYDRHFELHFLRWFRGKEQYKVYWEWLTGERKKPVYTQEPTPEVPGSCAFPRDLCVSAFAIQGSGAYFNNTVSWMLALAILLEPEKLGVWGVDMALNSEYGTQRPSCELFLGWAAGRGIEVVLPEECDLLKARKQYGFETDSDEALTKLRERKRTIHQHQQQLKGQHEQLLYNMGRMDGENAAYDYFVQWTGIGE